MSQSFLLMVSHKSMVNPPQTHPFPSFDVSFPPGKPEETKPAEAVTGNDITAPPNKELPPSPEKKTKVSVVPSSVSLLPWIFFCQLFCFLSSISREFCFLSCSWSTMSLGQRPRSGGANRAWTKVTQGAFPKGALSFQSVPCLLWVVWKW